MKPRAPQQKFLKGFDPAKLRSLRKEAGWTQEQAANRVKIPRVNYVSYESGNRNPGPQRVAALAKAFGVKIADLVTNPDPDLRDLRQQANMTQGECAAALGHKSKTTWVNYESGEWLLEGQPLKVIAKLFKISQAQVGEAAARSYQTS